MIRIVIIFKEYSSNHKKVYSFLKGLGFELLFLALHSNDMNKVEREKINLVDFGRLKKLNPAIPIGDIDNYIDRVFNKVVGNQSFNPFFRFFKFCRVNSLSK